jgi:hypothetical protein
MSFVKTILVCGSTIGLYEFFKNNPNNKYVKLTKLHVNKSIEICPFLKNFIK